MSSRMAWGLHARRVASPVWFWHAIEDGLAAPSEVALRLARTLGTCFIYPMTSMFQSRVSGSTLHRSNQLASGCTALAPRPGPTGGKRWSVRGM
jgi:hypothetical protein